MNILNKGNKKGQTIIEVMVAATLITIIMSAVLNLMYTGLKFSLRTREETIAIGKANKYMNEGLYKVNVAYPIAPTDLTSAFDLNTTEDGYSITRDLIGLVNNGIDESPEPGYGITENGQPVFMKMIIAVNKGDISYSDSRILKVR